MAIATREPETTAVPANCTLLDDATPCAQIVMLSTHACIGGPGGASGRVGDLAIESRLEGTDEEFEVGVS